MLSYSNKFSLGWATDLKTVAPHIVQKRILRTGDGTHDYSKLHAQQTANQSPEEATHIWGWQDEKLTDIDKSEVTVVNRTYKE